jgi:DNA-binding XRE family transcriptional regulator
MRKSFKELKEKMSPERRDRAEARTKEMIAEMLLTELRGQAGLTQEEVARKLGIKQPSLSKLESQKDMQISTLMRLVEALGACAGNQCGDAKEGSFLGVPLIAV